VVVFIIVIDIVYISFKNNRSKVIEILGVIVSIVALAITIFYEYTAVRLLVPLKQFNSIDKKQIESIIVVCVLTGFGLVCYIVLAIIAGTGAYTQAIPIGAFTKILVRFSPVVVFFTQSIWLFNNYRKTGNIDTKSMAGRATPGTKSTKSSKSPDSKKSSKNSKSTTTSKGSIRFDDVVDDDEGGNSLSSDKSEKTDKSDDE